MKVEILNDNCFKNGLIIRYPYHMENEQPEKIIKTTEENPSWHISQWFTNNSIAIGIIQQTNETLSLMDSTKKVKIYDNSVYLEINGSKEYKNPRKNDEPWPHLLLEQFFKNKMLKKYQSLKMNLNFDYLKFINHMKEEFNPNLHTSQFQWFLNFSNQNTSSKGYGDFFWFGLSFLDTPRYDFPPEFMAEDGGKEDATRKFIYIVDSHNYLNKPIKIMDQVDISFEVLDLIKQGFWEAKNRGFLKETNFEDLGFNSTNIGFEIPGTFDIGLRINKISLEATSN